MRKASSASFALYLRNGIWQAQFKNPDSGEWGIQKSTGTSDKFKALQLVNEWGTRGIPTDKTGLRRRSLSEVFSLESLVEAARRTPLTSEEAARIVTILRDRGLVSVSAVQAGPGQVDFSDFLMNFWSYENSPYVADRLAHGQRIGRRHCADMSSRVSVHWKPNFQGRNLSSITKMDLREFSVALAGKGLAATSVNKILIAGTAALTWAKENDLIPADPGEGLRRFSGTTRVRGVLEPSEVALIFKRCNWSDTRTYLANLTAACTGMRQGEILALKVDDIKTDRITVSHAWSDADGLKETKTGTIRQVPLLLALRRALLDLAASNPHGVRGFIFFGARPDRPMDGKPLLEDLKRAYIATRTSMGDDLIGEVEAIDEWKTRNLTFHGWRHYFSSRVGDVVDLRKLSNTTGHKSMDVLESYASHSRKDDFAEVGDAVAGLFSHVLASSSSVG